MTAPIARPENSAELSDADFESLDDAEWTEFSEWWARRTVGEYHLSDFSPREFITRMSWLRTYALRMRMRLQESKNAQHIHALQRENANLARQVVRLEEAPDSERVKKLLLHIERCHAEMLKWGLSVPSAGEFDGR